PKGGASGGVDLHRAGPGGSLRGDDFRLDRRHPREGRVASPPASPKPLDLRIETRGGRAANFTHRSINVRADWATLPRLFTPVSPCLPPPALLYPRHHGPPPTDPVRGLAARPRRVGGRGGAPGRPAAAAGHRRGRRRRPPPGGAGADRPAGRACPSRRVDPPA